MDNCVKDLLDKIIPSKTVKKYIADNQVEFTAEEVVSLACNTIGGLSKMKAYLNEIYESDTPFFTDKLKSEVKYIIDCANTVENWCESPDTSMVLLTDVTGANGVEYTTAVQNLECLNRLKADSKLDMVSTTISVVNPLDAKIYAWVTLEDDCSILDYSTDNELMPMSKLQDMYVRMPVDFKVGDRVRIVGNEQVYVVCSDNILPDDMSKSYDIFDMSVTVIPESVLERDKDFKEQIDNIISNRIKNLENDKESLDIISIEHEHISTILLEKVEDI